MTYAYAYSNTLFECSLGITVQIAKHKTPGPFVSFIRAYSVGLCIKEFKICIEYRLYTIKRVSSFEVSAGSMPTVHVGTTYYVLDVYVYTKVIKLYCKIQIKNPKEIETNLMPKLSKLIPFPTHIFLETFSLPFTPFASEVRL